MLNPHVGATKQIVYENAEYIISDEIDLCGDILELPVDCILNFHGGSLKKWNYKISKDRDTRLTSTERVLIIETGQSTKEMRSTHIIDTLSTIQKK